MLANETVRNAAKKAKVPLWMIASELGISEPTMTRKLRRELQDNEREQMLKIIKGIAHRQGGMTNE